jgi:hypothetical protein
MRGENWHEKDADTSSPMREVLLAANAPAL